jgi:hypothetical protein
MEEAVKRVEFAHPNRMLYLILAVGLNWMIFQWIPVIQRTAPPLKITMYNQRDAWNVDARIFPVGAEPYIVAGQNGQASVDIRQAHSLDYWTVHPNSTLPVNYPSMRLLEHHFASI